MLCDGRIVCGCADPYGKRVLGDARTASISEIWNDTRIDTLRAELNAGGSSFCGDCPLKLPLKGQAPTERSLDVGRLPNRLYIECTAACNISCTEACCAPETGITKTRNAGMLDFDLFKNVVDEAGPGLVRIDFFNYGEAFLHKRAIEMCEYIKTRFPHIYLYTSTNGLMFTEESAKRLVHSGIDEVTFSIDGASQDTYVQYRQRGKFDLALRNLRVMAEEKRRSRRDVPHLNWRYILFKWNDSDEEMNLARRLATEIGVDRLSWEITDHPENAFSRRFVPGTPGLRDHQARNLGHDRPRQRDSGRDAEGEDRSAEAVLPDAPVQDARGEETEDQDARRERVGASVSREGVIRPPARQAGRAVVRRAWHAARARLRARLAARNAEAGRQRRRPHRDRRAENARQLRVEVRSGQRRDRLVRKQRVADHAETARRTINDVR